MGPVSGVTVVVVVVVVLVACVTVSWGVVYTHDETGVTVLVETGVTELVDDDSSANPDLEITGNDRKRSVPYVLFPTLFNESILQGGKRKKRQIPTCGVPSALTAEQQDQIVLAHNEARAQEGSSNMAEMVWSEEIAARAQQLTDTCTWAHALMSDCSGTYIGQNLHAKMSNSVTSELQFNGVGVMASWYGEKENYNYEQKTCDAGKVCGHYTQAVWANSYELGCGATRCIDMALGSTIYKQVLIVACDYRPAVSVTKSKTSRDSASKPRPSPKANLP